MKYDTGGNLIDELKNNCDCESTGGCEKCNFLLRKNHGGRLIDPLYGKDILDKQIKEMAINASGIEQVWKITESWPSLTKLLLEDRHNI